jgi:hypothetical protein
LFETLAILGCGGIAPHEMIAQFDPNTQDLPAPYLDPEADIYKNSTDLKRPAIELLEILRANQLLGVLLNFAPTPV